MSNRASSFGDKGTVIAISVFAFVMLVVGVLFQHKVAELLTDYTEHQTKRQAEALAGQAAKPSARPSTRVGSQRRMGYV